MPASKTRKTTVSIGEVQIRVCGSSKALLPQHPLVLALQCEDRASFQQFQEDKQRTKHGKASSKESDTWEGLQKLVDSVKRSSFILCDRDPIVFKRKRGTTHWYCSHGRHRMCVAAYLYGPEALVSLRTQPVLLQHHHHRHHHDRKTDKGISSTSSEEVAVVAKLRRKDRTTISQKCDDNMAKETKRSKEPQR